MSTTPQDYYTWKQFVDEVKKLCPIDSRRKGVGQTDYFTALIRQAVIQLQSIIPEFQLGHETLYLQQDWVEEGNAIRAVKPPQSIIRDVFLVCMNSENLNAAHAIERFPVKQVAWADRFAMVNGHIPVNDGRAAITIDPQGYTFYLCPKPPEGESWAISLFWEGLKLDFMDEEQVPFTEMSVGAVADFVKARVALEVENNQTKFNDLMKLFDKTKPLLYVDAKERRSVLNQ